MTVPAWFANRQKARQRPYKTLTSKSGLQDFLSRPRDSFLWMKEKSKQADIRKLLFEEWNAFHTTPWNHQAVSTAIGMTEPHFLFNLGMGLGKSKVIADLLRYHKLKSGVKRGLVLFPNVINAEAWKDEFSVHAPDLHYEILMGSKSTRFNLINQHADAYFMNYRGLSVYMTDMAMNKEKGKRERVINPRMAEEFCDLFDFVAYDESHVLGKKQNLDYRLCHYLSKRCDIRYASTGTLFGRDPTLMWTQFNLIDHGYTLGESLGLFRSAFFDEFDSAWSEYSSDYRFNVAKTKELNRFIQHRSIRYTKEECFDMPPKQYIKQPLTWSTEALTFHTRLLDECRSRGISGVKISPNTYLNMRQITSGFVGYSYDESGERAKLTFTENPKLERLLQIVEGAFDANSSVVVYHEYIHTGKLIAEGLRAAKIKCLEMRGGQDNAAAYRQFVDAKQPTVLAANYKSGAAGGNFQKHCHYMVFFETPPDPITRKQCEERIDRPGQKNIVSIYDLFFPNDVTVKILESLKTGDDLYKSICKGKVITWE